MQQLYTFDTFNLENKLIPCPCSEPWIRPRFRSLCHWVEEGFVLRPHREWLLQGQCLRQFMLSFHLKKKWEFYSYYCHLTFKTWSCTIIDYWSPTGKTKGNIFFLLICQLLCPLFMFCFYVLKVITCNTSIWKMFVFMIGLLVLRWCICLHKCTWMNLNGLKDNEEINF